VGCALLALCYPLTSPAQQQPDGRAQQVASDPAPDVTASCANASYAARGDCDKLRAYVAAGGRDTGCLDLWRRAIALDAEIERLGSPATENSDPSLSQRSGQDARELAGVEHQIDMGCAPPSAAKDSVPGVPADTFAANSSPTPSGTDQPGVEPGTPGVIAGGSTDSGGRRPYYVPGGYNPCYNPVPPPGCPPVGGTSPGTDPGQPGGVTPCASCGRNPSPTSAAGEAVLCGNASPASAVLGADVDEYAKSAVPLSARERNREDAQGKAAVNQGGHPWCAVASAKVVLGAWSLAQGEDLPTLVGEVDRLLNGAGAPAGREHGYTMGEIGRLLRSKGLNTDVKNLAGEADPLGALAKATRAGPVIAGITLTQTGTKSGWFGRPQVGTVGQPHAVVVDGVEGKAPFRRVVIIDSVNRPTGAGTYSFYYREPEVEFLRAWRVSEPTGTERPILTSHPRGR